MRGVLLAIAIAVILLTPACALDVAGPAISPEVATAVQVAAAVL